jgi:hypothetical protein
MALAFQIFRHANGHMIISTILLLIGGKKRRFSVFILQSLFIGNLVNFNKTSFWRHKFRILSAAKDLHRYGIEGSGKVHRECVHRSALGWTVMSVLALKRVGKWNNERRFNVENSVQLFAMSASMTPVLCSIRVSMSFSFSKWFRRNGINVPHRL